MERNIPYDAHLHVVMPTSLKDRLYEAAAQDGAKPGEFVRSIIRDRLATALGGPPDPPGAPA